MSQEKTISIIGIGKLGLCFALTLERAGFNVTGIDVSQQYIDSLNQKTFLCSEPGVNEALTLSTNFRASINILDALTHSNIIFVVVATPSLGNGRYDHAQVNTLVDHLISFGYQKTLKHLVICCTTMPGYCDTINEKLSSLNYTVTYNPEFIAQGTILRDQLKPDMVLIGEGSPDAGDLIQQVYEDSTQNTPRICRMTRKEAEICKISLNCFLTTKISFANMIGDIAIASGCSAENILTAIGSDSRIGNKYLRHGFGYGGPCFPRDNRALAIYADDVGYDAMVSKATDKMNDYHLKFQVEQFKNAHSRDQPVYIESVAYKPGTDILEESQQLKFAVALASAGYSITIRDNESVLDQLKSLYGDLFFL